MKKLTFEYVKQYFEEHGCELMEKEYKNNSTKMEYKCTCGNVSKICFSHFKNGRRCMECSGKKKYTLEEVKQYFEDHDCKLLATEYKDNRTPMEYECNCGNSDCKISFNSFKNGNRCNKCGTERAAGKRKLLHKDVKQYFEDRNCELFEIEYINSSTKMRYRCACGNKECKISFNNFKKGHRCKKCAIERISGKNSSSYDPNLTDEEREKGRSCPGLGKWKKDVRKRDNHSCQYCGETEEKLCAHHIESYTPNKELRILVSNGILMCEKHHKEFHKEYGYGHNTREQLEEFLIRIF